MKIKLLTTGICAILFLSSCSKPNDGPQVFVEQDEYAAEFKYTTDEKVESFKLQSSPTGNVSDVNWTDKGVVLPDGMHDTYTIKVKVKTHQILFWRVLAVYPDGRATSTDIIRKQH